MEVAVLYGVMAWLGCLLVDLTIIIVRGPMDIGPVVKWIVVLACLAIIMMRTAAHGWLM